jgi:hypothetical protein
VSDGKILFRIEGEADEKEYQIKNDDDEDMEEDEEKD